MFTFLGIASPNKRPTLFDVFRQRKGSDAKKRDPPKSAGSDRDSNSSASGGSGGIVQSMKAAIQHTVGSTRPEATVGVKKAVKDGSAHPHAGSDAQVSSRSF